MDVSPLTGCLLGSALDVFAPFLVQRLRISDLDSLTPCHTSGDAIVDIWGLEAFRKRESAYRLPIAFPRGGALAASIWPIADYQACDRPLNQLDRT